MPADRDLAAALIGRTLRVPVDGTPGDGAATARQLDVALLAVGFKCSAELLDALSAMHPVDVTETGRAALSAVRQLVGDHVAHNAYFADFPAGVPDTEAFWAQCVGEALLDPQTQEHVGRQLMRGVINLLDLPRYGRYQHTYEEMCARHTALVESAKDRVTVLGLGGPLATESHALYVELAGSPMPPSADDLALLGRLAAFHVLDAQPAEIPVRECRAVVNAARVEAALEPEVDTVTDVLRLACALSAGDVTLEVPTRLRSFGRAQRRTLLAALDRVIEANPGKLADVRRHTEPFKRLGERLHPHDYPRYTSAADVFAVARGEKVVRSIAGRVDLAITSGDPDAAVEILRAAPGALLRAVDHLARSGADPGALATAVRDAAGVASLRVVLGLRAHLLGRDRPQDVSRIFVNQQGGAWAVADERPPLSPAVVATLAGVLDDAIVARLPAGAPVVVDPDSRAVALPLSGKGRAHGLGLLPRGSSSPVSRLVRFFVYWKERERTTDLDLSVLLLDEHFTSVGQVSYTNLTTIGAVHSGDVVSAPEGATEFIELDLGAVRARYVVPLVNVFSGESFDQTEEAFFGFMERNPAQGGRPFEPRTVRAKSDLVGAGRVGLPLVFGCQPDGRWTATWMHLNLGGRPSFNRVEEHQVSTSMLARGILEREYLTFDHLVRLLRERGEPILDASFGLDPGVPVTYFGTEAPADLPAGSTVITPSTFWEALA